MQTERHIEVNPLNVLTCRYLNYNEENLLFFVLGLTQLTKKKIYVLVLNKLYKMILRLTGILIFRHSEVKKNTTEIKCTILNQFDGPFILLQSTLLS